MQAIERRFNPDQPRDGDGRWTDGLADRISLGARERLVSSKRFRPGRGSYRSFDDTNAAAAVVEGPRGREVRLGVVATVDDDADQWDADTSRDDTTTLNRRGLRRLRNDLSDAAGKATGAGDDDDEAVASGESGGVEWSVFLEDDGSYSTSVRVGDGDGLTLDAKQLDRFLAYLDDLDGQLETTRSQPRVTPRAPDKPAETRLISRGEPAVLLYDRTFALDDIQISRAAGGRTVEAYAAIFEAPYEVADQHGHYMEVIERSAFDRTLRGGAGAKAMCLYNHGMSVVTGQPDSLAQIPLGTPLEVRADRRGLLTVTRYNEDEYADRVLEAIRNGAIKAQSFRGRIFRSSPNGKVPRTRHGGALPTVTRHELGLSDYGPTPIPVNQGAEIVAVRSVQDLVEELQELDADEREELLRSLNLEVSTHDGDPDDGEDEDDGPDEVVDDTATPDESGPGAEDPPAEEAARHSGRQQKDLARRIRAAMLIRSHK